MRRCWPMLFLVLLGACRGGGAEDRPPYLLIRMTVPESFPSAKVAAAEIQLLPIEGQPAPPFSEGTVFWEVGGIPVTLSTRDRDGDGRREVRISFGRNPLDGRSAQIYLYGQRHPSAGGGPSQSPPFEVQAQVMAVDGTVLAQGTSSLALDGEPIRFAEVDRTVEVALTCVAGSGCEDRVTPLAPGTGTVRVTVTRARECPTTDYRGDLHLLLMPGFGFGGGGAAPIHAIHRGVSFAAVDTTVTLDLSPSVAGTYFVQAIHDVGGDLVAESFAPALGDLRAPLRPVEIALGRTVPIQVVLDEVVGVGACSGGPLQAPEPPMLVVTSPNSPANENAPFLLGSAQPGALIRLHTDAACTSPVAGQGSADAMGAFRIPVMVADNSQTTFYATATNAQGYRSACSPGGLVFVEDSVNPAAPSGLGTEPPSPANETRPAVTGTAEPGAEVAIFGDATCEGAPLAVGVADAAGAFRVVVEVAENTENTFYVRVTDAAGNPSACSGAGATFVEDSSAPAMPLLTGTSPASPANNNRPAITGTAEPGVRVSLYLDPACASALALAGTADVAGGFSIPVDLPDNTTVTFYAKATDAAGNASRCSTSFLIFTEDSVAPATPLNVATAPPSPANENNPALTGLAEPGSAVAIFANGTCAGSPLVTGAASALGHFSISVNVADGSTTTFSVQSTDLAGNGSPCSSAIVYVEDSTIPGPPQLTGTTPPSPANHNNPLVQGSAAPGARVRLYVDPGCSISFAEGNADGNGAFAIAVNLVDDTATTFFARAINSAGSPSACSSSSVTFVEDSTPPPPPILNRSQPPSPSTSDSPTLVGVAAAGATIRLFTNASCAGTPVATATTDGAGQFAVAAGTVVANTVTTFYAQALDAAGNGSGCSEGFAYLQDGQPPAFGGAAAAVAVSTTAIALSWAVAADNFTSSELLTYEICQSARPRRLGGCQPFAATQTTPPGSTGYEMVGLAESTRYYFTVRARDQVGNTDPNVVEVTAKTMAARAARAIASGGGHSCAILSEGTVRCWGRNDAGQLGDGSSGAGADKSLPVRVTGLSAVIGLGLGDAHSCAVLVDGTVHCWGAGSAGQLGDGAMAQSATPVPVIGLSNARSVAAGGSHTCAIRSPGAVWCWGNNSAGQLGDGTTTPSDMPLQVPGIADAVALALGFEHTCAVRANGTTLCWGQNAEGQAGQDPAVSPTVSAPTAVLGASNTLAIAAGANHNCVLTAGGVACWGREAENQIGVDDVPQYVPRASGPQQAVAIGAGGNVSCSVSRAGTVSCWGDDTMGQDLSAGVANVVGVSAGATHACALSADGRVQCWGDNGAGQLGDGTTTPRTGPAVVSSLVGVVSGIAIAAGTGHACALLADGTVQCWGDNSAGQLGDGTLVASAFPLLVGNLPLVDALAAGSNHTCAALSDGTARCWGANAGGQLGDGSTFDRNTPVAVSGLTDVVKLASGGGHTCALLADRTARCWGRGGLGQLGDGIRAGRSTPVTVSGISGAARIVSGLDHSCALVGSSVMCWGSNYQGQIGQNLTGPPGCTSDGCILGVETSLSPVLVSIFPGGIIDVAAGESHTCSLNSEGNACCFGVNDERLGPSIMDFGCTFGLFNPSSPVDLSGSAIALTAGRAHTCALFPNGTVRCWGRNDAGQLGEGTTHPSSTPVEIPGLSDVIQISASGDLTCAILADGTARCWGINDRGQVGDGTTTPRPSPVAVEAFP